MPPIHIENVLDLALRHAEGAEVFWEQGEATNAVFENNRLKSVETKQSRGVGLRVIRNGRIGHAGTTAIDERRGDIERLVRNVMDSAAFGQEARFQFPDRCDAQPVKTADQAVTRVPVERCVDMGREGIERVLSAAPDAQCEAEVSKSSGTWRLLNSNGLDVECSSTAFSTGLHALRVRGESLLGVGEGETWASLTDGLGRHADEIVRKMRLAENEVSAPSAAMPVIFMPKVLGVLLSTFEASTNGKTVQKGASVLAGRLGDSVLDERVTIWDDALVDYAPGSSPADAEGVPTRRFPLFEKGTLANFVYDLHTAGMMGVESTGSATRSFASLPAPGNANIIMEPGDTAFEDMVLGLKRGLIVDQVLGAGQSNVLAGEFSVNVDLGFLVEDGRIVGRVKNCMVAGNAFDAFNNIAAIGDRAEWHGGAKLPAVCFKNIVVAGRAQE